MKKFTQQEYLVSLLCAVISFIVYSLTTARGIVFTDNGELLGVMSTFGVPHPTGSPLFMMFSSLWDTFVRVVSSSVFSKNLFSAAMVSIGVSVLHLTVVSLIQTSLKEKYNSWYKNTITVSMVLLVAFSSSLWNIATYLEMYSLQFFAFSCVFFAFVQWSLRPTIQISFVVSYLSVLAIATHSSMVFFALAVNSIIIIHNYRSVKNIKPILVGLSLMLFAITVYAVPLLRSYSDVPFNWGEISRSYDAFMYHIRGKQFHVWMFESKETFIRNSGDFIKELGTSTFGVGIVLSVVSLFILWKKNTSVVLLVFVYFVVGLPFILSYGIPDIQSYFVIPIVLVSVFASISLLQWCVKYQWIAYVVAILPCCNVALFWEDVHQHKNTLVEDYVSMLTEQLPKNSIILSSQWDYFCSAFWYKQKIEGYRPDIVLIESELMRRTWYPQMVKRWYPEVYRKSQKEFEAYTSYLSLFENEKPFEASKLQRLYIVLLRSIIENAGRNVVFCTPEVIQSANGVAEGYKTIPQGLVLQITKNEIDTTFTVKKINPRGFFNSPVRSKQYLEPAIHRTFMLSMGYTSSYLVTQKKLEEGIRAKDLATTSSILIQKVTR